VKPRVLLADDHPPTLADLRHTLERDGTFEVCAVAADAAEAVAQATEARPDVCVLDVNMPGSGVAAAWEIAGRLPETKVVMLTVSDEDVDLFAALRAGAVGYLLKDADLRTLPRVLEAVLAGETALPRALVGRVVEGFRDPNARRRVPLGEPDTPHLTSREWQILALLRSGLTTTQIARRLVVSPVTVRTHVSGIVHKLGLSSRDELLSQR
jgi:two-component system, NarL family, nitrate/nitrite response regulator NarL